MSHEYTPKITTSGNSVFHQSHCSCGWLSGQTHNGDGAVERAQCEFDEHVRTAVVPSG